MKRSSKIAIGIVASLTLGLGSAAYAHQGETGDGAHGKGGMQHGMQGATGHSAGGHGAQMQARMAQMHTQMQTREHGAAGPRHQGPRSGAAAGSATAQTPGTTEHAH